MANSMAALAHRMAAQVATSAARLHLLWRCLEHCERRPRRQCPQQDREWVLSHGFRMYRSRFDAYCICESNHINLSSLNTITDRWLIQTGEFQRFLYLAMWI